MNKLLKFMLLIEEWIVKILLICIVFLVFLAALSRSFGYPLTWSVEMAMLIFPWFVFLAVSIALQNDDHIGFEAIFKILSVRGKQILNVIHLILIMFFLAYLIYFGTKLSIENFARQLSALSISYSFVTGSLVVGSVSMFIKSLIKMFVQINQLTNKKEA